MSDSPRRSWKILPDHEDWLAVWIGAVVLALNLFFLHDVPADAGKDPTQTSAVEVVNPLAPWLMKFGPWESNPLASLVPEGDPWFGVRLAAMAVFVALLFTGASTLSGSAEPGIFLRGFLVLFVFAALAYFLASQTAIRGYGLEYPLWALAAGMLISNTRGVPRILEPALRTELYIKTGLVIFGAEILLARLMEYGIRGIFIAWVVTPIVLVTTYWFGQKIIRVPSRSLNMTLSADMSVCGVSAAIATAAACKAKKEELSLAIGVSLTFTVIMMVVLPAVIRATGMGEDLGGAWIGGTIDSTGAVAAAGALLGDTALNVATTIKLIQNMLIGVISFCVAVYWVGWVERDEGQERPNAWEVWHRFPKFVLGFLGASLIFSTIFSYVEHGPEIVSATTGATKNLRGWLFCLGFASIGFETRFRELAGYLHGGKPLMLYVAGQALNLTLTLTMAWLVLRVFLPLE